MNDSDSDRGRASGARGRSQRGIGVVLLIVAAVILAGVPATRAQGPTFTRQGLVLPMGPPGTYDSLQAFRPSVLVEGGLYRMWYSGCPPSESCVIAYATSADGRNWTKLGPVLTSIGGNESIVGYPDVVRVGGTYWMFYDGYDGSAWRMFAATSPDGLTWTRQGMVVDHGPAGSTDAFGPLAPSVVYVGGEFVMWYTAASTALAPQTAILRATSSDGLHWTKQGAVLGAGTFGFVDSYSVMTPSVTLVGSEYEMAFTGFSSQTNMSILYATSSDGVVWRNQGVVLTPQPPSEDGVGQPDLVVLPTGAADLYYVVRNDYSDLQIYLATAPEGSFAPGGTTPSGGLTPTVVATVLIVLAGSAAVVAVAVTLLFLRRRGPPPEPVAPPAP